MKNSDLEELYNKYFKTVYKYLICLTHNKELAEDLSQETFCNAINKIDKFRGDCKISVWLCEIAKNLWLNELKKNKRIILTDNEQDLANIKYNTEDKFFLEQDKIELHKKIYNLDEKVKEIFYLRLFANLSFKEIGEIMGKSEVWVRVNFYRGKEKLKESDENGKRM